MNLQTSRQTSMSPALQRALSMLQLSTLEFAQQLRESLASNPLLESDEDIDAPGETSAGESTPSDENEHDRIGSPEPCDDLLAPQRDDWQSLSAQGANATRDPDFDPVALTPETRSLRDMLLAQAGCLNIDRRDLTLITAIIDALEPTGYLECGFDELAGCLAAQGLQTIEPGELEIALRHVQQFEPAGVGARSVQECLALQLRAMSADTPGRDAAIRIVTQHLELFAARDFPALAQAAELEDHELAAATVLIRRLSPRPGLSCANDTAAYVVPDVQVLKSGGRWLVRLRRGVLPSIRVNEMYCDMLRSQSTRESRAMTAQLQEARWLVRSIEQRQSTVLRVAQAIVARQREFFEFGDIGMKPMTLRDVADELGLHESTVSRVTANKYMVTPAGVIEFKRFFTAGIDTARGEPCSAIAVKAMIRQLIGGESEEKPLSDHRLTKLLSHQGIQVARRTVSKYRDTMQIPPAEIRRLSHRATA